MMKFVLFALVASCALTVVLAGGDSVGSPSPMPSLECPICIFKNAIRGIVDWPATDFSFVNPGSEGTCPANKLKKTGMNAFNEPVCCCY